MAKKSFNEITNPALQFMTAPVSESEKKEEPAPEFSGLKRGRKPSTEETKSKRLNLLLLPSVFMDLTKLATMKRCSVNELINSVLQQYIADNTFLLEKYQEVFGGSDDR